MSFSVTIENFKTKEQALEFLKWYEGGGEQDFHMHLNDNGLSTKDGCCIDVSKKRNTGRYWQDNGDNVTAWVK